MTTTAAPQTSRFIGRCKVCKTVQVQEVVDSNEWRFGRSCCGKGMQLLKVRGTMNEKKRCDSRCTHAVTAACNCSCEGENHGKWFA